MHLFLAFGRTPGGYRSSFLNMYVMTTTDYALLEAVDEESLSCLVHVVVFAEKDRYSSISCASIMKVATRNNAQNEKEISGEYYATYPSS